MSSILVLVQNLPLPFDRRVWQECLTLKKNGYEVTAISPSNAQYPQGEYLIDGVRVVRFRSTSEADSVLGYVREYSSSLVRMLCLSVKYGIKVRGFKVVQFCNPPDLLAVVALFSKILFKSKLVFDQHDLGPELLEAKGLSSNKLALGIVKIAEKAAYRISDEVIATNQSYRELAIARGGVRPENCTIVRSGPPREWGSAEPDFAISAEPGFKLGYLGVIGVQEGLDLALRALVLLSADNARKVTLHIVGDGTERNRIERLAMDLKVERMVKFHGRVSDARLKEILSAMDVCINPDRFNQLNNLSTMNKIIEYMALGRPIVQFDLLEGRRSALSSSLYAKPDDIEDFATKIRDSLDDPALRSSQSKFAIDRFNAALSWDVQGALYAQVIEKLIRG